MPLATPILQTTLGGKPPNRQGKVRDIYEFADELLIVASDRISAFDYVLGSGIPDKGKVLTQISAFWFDRTRALVPNHVISIDVASFPEQVRAAREPWVFLTGRARLAVLESVVLVLDQVVEPAQADVLRVVEVDAVTRHRPCAPCP